MAKVKLGDSSYHMQAQKEVCHFNSGVLCGLWASPTGRDRCTKCGWNPVVFQIRKERMNNVETAAAQAEGG